MHRFVFLAAAALIALPIIVASAAIPDSASATRGADHIAAHERADGSYGVDSFGQNMDAIVAIRAAGFDPAKDQLPGGKTPAEYLAANAGTATQPATAAKAALAAKALGLDPTAVGGTNLIANVTAGLDSQTGKYATDDFSQSIAMLGLACTGNAVPASASTAIKSTQVNDGGWGFQGTSDPDTTAIAVQALLAAGVPNTDASVTKAITFLKTTQLADGGWGFAPDSNAASTAFVVQALLAAGESIDIPQYIQAGASPTSFLLSQQQADGSFLGFDSLYATFQVVPAMAGRTFCNAADTPITQVRQQPTATPSPTVTTTPVATTTPGSTATPAATTSATTTVAPGAPNTGSGSNGGGSNGQLPLFAGLLLIVSAGAGAVAVRRVR